jgi:hypothetical protein
MGLKGTRNLFRDKRRRLTCGEKGLRIVGRVGVAADMLPLNGQRKGDGVLGVVWQSVKWKYC